MKTHLLTFLLILGLTSPAWARLGETQEQLVTRYGQTTGSGTGNQNKAAHDWLQFKKGGYIICVWLLNGVSAEESVTKEDYYVNPSPLAQIEIKTLLETNAQGHAWKEVIVGTKWIRDDGAIAGGRLNFSIKSEELIDANANAEKPTATSLKGF